jgi:hypothetical protein
MDSEHSEFFQNSQINSEEVLPIENQENLMKIFRL